MKQRDVDEVLRTVYNNPVSKRYVPKAINDEGNWAVFDQTDNRFLRSEELSTIDPEAKMVLH